MTSDTLPRYPKDKDEKLDYAIDWSRWLPDGDGVSSVVWTVPTGLTKVAESQDATKTLVWLSGGADDTSYEVRARMTSAAGRIAEDGFIVDVTTSITYRYDDAYLAPLVTKARERRAIADVAEYGTLPDAWVERLVRSRVYVLICLESQKAPDDLFASKLAAYRREFDRDLPIAMAAQRTSSGTVGQGSLVSIPLERA